MLLAEIVCGSVLVVVLVALAAYHGRHQARALRQLRQTPDLPTEEQRYERSKAYRRLVSCVLLMVLAGLLTGLLVVAGPASRIAEERKDLDPNIAPRFTPEQRTFLRYWGWAWMAVLGVLSAVLVLAAVDLLSTRRYALRQFRRLQADRRAMIQRQANRLRRERGGDD